MGLSEFSFSMQMRDTIEKMVANKLDQLRPKYRYATVNTIDRVNNKATVTFIGESNPVIVNMGAVQPTAVGCTVRIAGYRGDRYIADVIGASADLLGGLNRTTMLGSGVDLNTLTVEGRYVQSSSSYATLALNYPIGVAGSLEVWSNHASMYWQKYTPYGINQGKFYTRAYYTSTGWTAWSAWIAESDTGWVDLTLQNGWIAYGSPFATPQYRVKNGLVRLKGLIKNGTSTAGTVLFTMPAGTRPIERLLFPVYISATIGRIDIEATGNALGQIVASGYTSLDNISWYIG